MTIDPHVAAEIDHLADDAWAWMIDNTHPKTGLTLDRAANSRDAANARDGHRPRTAASLGGTGFYLSLLPVAVERHQLTDHDAATRAATTMRFVLDHVDHVGGVVLHFVDWETGRRAGTSEYSVLDTSIFLNACMVAAQRFGGACATLCDALLTRVQWEKLTTAHPRTGKRVLAYHYDGATKQLARNAVADVRSSENLMPCVLACGTPDNDRDATGPWCWENMAVVATDAGTTIGDWRPPAETVGLLNPRHGLFTSYYGLAWMNLAGVHDADGVDLHVNARRAALFNRAACRNVWARQFKTYTVENGGWWGISAGDGPTGYVAPNPVDGDPTGAVWPAAALAAFPWIPEELAADVARWLKSASWPRSRGRGAYGLAPFSIDRDWAADELISIDLGSFATNWWNYRLDGIVQKLWYGHPVARRGLDRLNFSAPRH